MEFNFSKENLIEKEQRRIFFGYWLRRLFIDDWLIKLTALAITLALWLGVTGLQAPTTTRLRSVTLNPRIPNNLEIINSPVQEVDLVITGEKRKLDQINPRDIVVSLDLTSVQEGERTIQITPDNVVVDLPTGIKIDEILPDKIAIKLESVGEYVIPIRPETTGDPKQGYEVYNSRTTPEKVKVRGPKSFVESMSFVATEKIDITDRASDFRVQQIPLRVVNPKVTLVDAVSASIFFRVGKRRIERLFVVPYSTDSRAGRASVLLYGPNTLLEDLAVDDLQIIEMRNETETVKLSVLLPEELREIVEIRSVKFRE